ncbi:MAG: hypothetical protein HKN76_02810 [Saprospiraceae bacterium]|nr:hypothetical protein [Saprospiraceae bacterium]
MRIVERDFLILLAFCLFAVLLRWPTFLTTVIDHDESTYIIIADQLLQGYFPYVHNVDVKPPGIYLLFSGILTLFDSIFAIRVFAAIIVGVTGFILYRSHQILFSFPRVAIASGVLFVICASAHKWSWSANTEVFFTCCTATCLYLLLIARKNWHFLFFGFIASIGFLIKFHIAFDILALAIFYLFWQGGNFKSWIKQMSLAFFAFSIPLLSLFFIYLYLGYEDHLRFALFSVPAGYRKEFSFLPTLGYLSEFYLSFLPFTILWISGIYWSFRHKWLMPAQWVLLVVTTIIGWIGILITGKLFFHYYFQALLPFCLFAFLPFMNQKGPYYFRWQNLNKVLFPIGSFLVLVVWLNQYIQIGRKPDVPKMVYEEIVPNWDDNKRVYTNYKNIIYYLLDTRSPTKFTHTSILFHEDLIASYQVDTEQEFQSIVDQKMDYYILKDQASPVIENDIKQNFKLVKVFPENVILYTRISKGE